MKVAVVGAGPTGLLFCEKLIRILPSVRINVLERNFSPYGLIRYGVAPDHVDIKNYSRRLHSILLQNNVKFYGGLDVGTHVRLEDLKATHHAVVFCSGMFGLKYPDLTMSKIPGCFAAGDVVKWYNGASTTAKVDFPKDANVAIIGNGNVAADVARILLSNPDSLSKRDISENALNILRERPVKSVTVFGRRSPWEAAFTVPELRQLLSLQGVKVRVDFESEELISCKNMDLSRKAHRLSEVWLEAKERKPEENEGPVLAFAFNQRLQKATRLEGKTVLYFESGIAPAFDAVVFCIGFTSELEHSGLPLTKEGCIETLPGGQINGEPGCFAVGWAAEGPKGVLAHSLASANVAAQIVAKYLSNLDSQRFLELDSIIHSKGLSYISKRDWEIIDSIEMTLGSFHNASRRKLSQQEALAIARRLSS